MSKYEDCPNDDCVLVECIEHQHCCAITLHNTIMPPMEILLVAAHSQKDPDEEFDEHYWVKVARQMLVSVGYEALKVQVGQLKAALTGVLEADIARGPHDQHAVSEIGNDRCVYCGNFWPCPNARAWTVLNNWETPRIVSSTTIEPIEPEKQ